MLSEEILLEKAAGRVSAGFVTIYPPGIPQLCPGEVIDPGTCERLAAALSAGRTVDGVRDGRMRVLLKDGE